MVQNLDFGSCILCDKIMAFTCDFSGEAAIYWQRMGLFWLEHPGTRGKGPPL